MSRMTLEEKILQTDQYYSGDFTTQDENGKVTAVDMQRFDALMRQTSPSGVVPLIKFVDMFSGIGGFREGLTRAGGFTCVGHCEIDKYANRSYNALFDTKGEWFIEDARKADPGTMPDFQLLCGGFPCQSYPE